MRVMLCYCYFFRGQQHHHLPPLEPRKLLHDTMWLQVAADTLQQPDAEFLMRHLPPAKAQRDLGFVAFAEESDQIPQVDLVIALVSAGPEFDFLDLDLLELEPCLMLALGFAILELAEIHDPANRRLGQGGNIQQIEFRVLSLCDRVRNRHDAKLFTFHAYQANFGSIDLAVDSLRSVLGYLVFT